MAADHFEVELRKRQNELKDALMRSSAGDQLKDANIRGQFFGLEIAFELYRKAVRIDADGDR